jgi:hypothetical protein
VTLVETDTPRGARSGAIDVRYVFGFDKTVKYKPFVKQRYLHTFVSKDL